MLVSCCFGQARLKSEEEYVNTQCALTDGKGPWDPGIGCTFLSLIMGVSIPIIAVV